MRNRIQGKCGKAQQKRRDTNYCNGKALSPRQPAKGALYSRKKSRSLSRGSRNAPTTAKRVRPNSSAINEVPRSVVGGGIIE